MITVSKEDYLKAVSEAEAEGQTVIAATLAHWLSVSRPAVTTALKRLKKDGLVIVKSDGRIQLTAGGRFSLWNQCDPGFERATKVQ
jgi:DtxR family Mn-dependent transcriptional regulator